MTEHNDSSPSPAGFFPRFYAFAIDITVIFCLIGIMVLLILLFHLTSLGMGMHAPASREIRSFIDDITLAIEPALQTPSEVTAAVLILMLLKWYLLIIVPVYVLYSAGYEASARQATPGKTALHLVVTSQEGRPIGLFQSFGRTAAKILCILPLGAGMLPLMFSKGRGGLHDYCTRTRVMKGEPNLHADPIALRRADKFFSGILMLVLAIMYCIVLFRL